MPEMDHEKTIRTALDMLLSYPGREDKLAMREAALSALTAFQEERERIQAASIEAYLIRQWEWSRRTFGDDYRMEQITAHIRKELAEVEANPGDRVEWIDIALLALDGYNRCAAGTAETLMPDMQAKQDRNFARVWVIPADPRAAVEHDRSADAAIGEPAAEPAVAEYACNNSICQNRRRAFG